MDRRSRSRGKEVVVPVAELLRSAQEEEEAAEEDVNLHLHSEFVLTLSTVRSRNI